LHNHICDKGDALKTDQNFDVKPEMAALAEAIRIAGGVGALAEAIGVPSSTPSMWKKRGSIPAEYCPDIEAATGVFCERLRPDVSWNVVRVGKGQPSPASVEDV
jgi:DNA-binding transcriptional regulator YdaS (Cro superfamily)